MMEIIEFQTLYITELGKSIQINQGIENKNYYSSGTIYNDSLYAVYVNVVTIGFKGTKQLIYIPSGKAIKFRNIPIQLILVPTNIKNQTSSPNLIIQITSFITDESVIPEIDTKPIDIKRPIELDSIQSTFNNGTLVFYGPAESNLSYEDKWDIYNIWLQFTSTQTVTTTFQVSISTVPNGETFSVNNYIYYNNFSINPSQPFTVLVGRFLENIAASTLGNQAQYQMPDLEMYPNDLLYLTVNPNTLTTYYIGYKKVPLDV